MKKIVYAGLAALPVLSCAPEKPVEKPNIIFILADDLGYGDLSCYGQEKFSTPNIDRLAQQGKLFTQHYAGCSVSAPSRSSVITGLNTGHTPIRGNKEMGGEGQYPIPASTSQIFKFLQANGYVTGCFGKWGLGAPSTEGAPEVQGVDEFFGYNCQRLAHNYYPDHLWHNAERIVLEGNQGRGEEQYAPYLIHDKALDFIDINKDRPFFLWYTTTIPHAELRLPEEEIAPLRGLPQFEPEVPYEGIDEGPQYKTGGYGSQETPHAAFAAMVTLLDKQVGEISAKLDELGIAENTILVFASDNGPHKEGGADPEFFNSNGPLRGVKRDLYEGGIRVPLIVRWPGHVEAGTTSDHISAFWDFLPTVADVIGVELDFPTDGISMLPELTGEGVQQEHDQLYWEFHEGGGRVAIRRGDWKAVVYNITHGGKMQLYNLAVDPGEEHDLAAEHPEMIEEFRGLFRASRVPSDIFNFKHKPYKGGK